jgi:hypothetical protein
MMSGVTNEGVAAPARSGVALDHGSPSGPSKGAIWTGRVISALPVLVLTMSAVVKFMPPNKQTTEGFEHLGWPLRYAVALGIVELTCTLIYVIPQTAVLGAILLTGYMGGAIATHARVGDNFVLQAVIGVLVWLGLFLRDVRLRSLVPLRRLP